MEWLINQRQMFYNMGLKNYDNGQRNASDLWSRIKPIIENNPVSDSSGLLMENEVKRLFRITWKMK